MGILKYPNIMYFNICVVYLLGIAAAQDCGIGSQCQTKTGTTTCTACPGGTACTQWTTSSGNLGAFYCQYTFCLPKDMYCGGRVGTCCSGLDCGLATTDATIRTCNMPATTTTTSTTTTSTTTITSTASTTTATTATTTTDTTTPAIVIVTEPGKTTTTMPTTSTTLSGATCQTIGGAKIGLPCIFPFTNKGVTYTACTTSGGFDKPWCSTSTDILGNHKLGNWGDCNEACGTEEATTGSPSTCNTTSGSDSGQACVFPFTHKGVVHKACTYAGGFSKPWYSTKVDYWGRHREGFWGNCDKSCKVKQIWG